MKAPHAKTIVLHKMNQYETGKEDRIIGPFEYNSPFPKKIGAICPWHYEITPSLIINFSDQTAVCLTCGVKNALLDAQWEEDGFAWAWVRKTSNENVANN